MDVVSKKLRRIFIRRGITVRFTPSITLRQTPVHPNDHEPKYGHNNNANAEQAQQKRDKCSAVYLYKQYEHFGQRRHGLKKDKSVYSMSNWNYS